MSPPPPADSTDPAVLKRREEAATNLADEVDNYLRHGAHKWHLKTAYERYLIAVHAA